MGIHPYWWGLDAARQEARRHRRYGKRPPRCVRRVVRRRQYSHRGWTWRQPMGSIGALWPRRGWGGELWESPHPWRPPTIASSSSADLMTAEALARRRRSRAATVALENRQGQLLHPIRR